MHTGEISWLISKSLLLLIPLKSVTLKSFIDRNPELQDGAVIIKVDVEGQGRRRTNEIDSFLMKMKYRTNRV